MSALDIRPHSARISGYAIAGLMVLGAGAFGLGLVHQLQPAGPSPFPPAQQQTLQIAVATLAPELQAASPAPAPARHAPPEIPADPASPSLVTTEAAQAPPAVDASANAPDQPAPAAQPQPPADDTPPT